MGAGKSGVISMMGLMMELRKCFEGEERVRMQTVLRENTRLAELAFARRMRADACLLARVREEIFDCTEDDASSLRAG